MPDIGHQSDDNSLLLQDEIIHNQKYNFVISAQLSVLYQMGTMLIASV